MPHKIVGNLGHWPRSNSGDPIFTCIEDSFFFAQLIFNKETERLRLARSCKRASISLQATRNNSTSGISSIYLLSIKHFYYQTCLSELGRIEREGP